MSHVSIHPQLTVPPPTAGSYVPHYWFWELLEAFKRLYLMGFTVFVWRGSVTQLLVSAVVSLAYLAFVMQVMVHTQ